MIHVQLLNPLLNARGETKTMLHLHASPFSSSFPRHLQQTDGGIIPAPVTQCHSCNLAKIAIRTIYLPFDHKIFKKFCVGKNWVVMVGSLHQSPKLMLAQTIRTLNVMNMLQLKETKMRLKKTKVNLEKHWSSTFKKNIGLLEGAFACVRAHTLPLLHSPAFPGERTSFKANGFAFSLHLHRF